MCWRVVQVREANKERSRLTTSQKREIGLATMLLCVVAVFFIFNIMAMVVSIFEMANILVDEMTRVSNLLVSANSSVNFIIYCIFGDKFQRLFLRYFWYCVCCCKILRPPYSGEACVTLAHIPTRLHFHLATDRTQFARQSRLFHVNGQLDGRHEPNHGAPDDGVLARRHHSIR